MERIPFLIAIFLFINPFLDWLFWKREVEIEKLQFWIMVSSGTAWVIAILYFLLDPNASINPPPRPGIELLPQLYFSFDWIATGLILTATAVVFFRVLSRQNAPRENAWLAGMGGACVIGLGSYSAYTLGLTWAILEAFHFYFSYQDQQISSNPRKFIPVALIRLSAPGALITLSLTQSEAGLSTFAEILNPITGPILIGAGLVGFLGWFLSYKSQEKDPDANSAGASENWLSGLMSLMLILRGGEFTGGADLGWLPLILSILLLLSSVAGLLLARSARLWFLGCGLMVAVSTFIAGPVSGMSWGLMMSLAAYRLWGLSDQPRKSLILLSLAFFGVLPLPFFPSWLGVGAFSKGLAGILLGLSAGVLLGSVLLTVLKNWSAPASEPESDSHPLPAIIGAAVLLVSQIAISFRLGLLAASQGLLGKPLLIWISLVGLIPVLILGNHLPLKKGQIWLDAGSRVGTGLSRGLRRSIRQIDRVVDLFSRVFEGQGGLIWALLIGLFIITLVSLRGG